MFCESGALSRTDAHPFAWKHNDLAKFAGLFSFCVPRSHRWSCIRWALCPRPLLPAAVLFQELVSK